MKEFLNFILFYSIISNFGCSTLRGAEPVLNKKLLLTKVLDDSTQNAILNKKSPTGALLRSMVFPGWGQWYNGQKIKAAVVFTAESFLIGSAIYLNKKVTDSEVGSLERDFYRDRRNLTHWLIGGFTLLSMLDAYVDAYLYDFDTGPDLALRVGALSTPTPMEMPMMILGLSLRAKF